MQLELDFDDDITTILSNMDNTNTIDLSGSAAQPTFTFDSMDLSDMSATAMTIIGNGGGGGASGIYTIQSTTGGGGGSGAPYITLNDWGVNDIKPSAKITLTGDDADIDINGTSLVKTLKSIQDRLNILTPDPDMEQEWEELRELRELYDAKLEACREKSRMWKTLKSMPPPPKP